MIRMFFGFFEMILSERRNNYRKRFDSVVLDFARTIAEFFDFAQNEKSSSDKSDELSIF